MVPNFGLEPCVDHSLSLKWLWDYLRSYPNCRWVGTMSSMLVLKPWGSVNCRGSSGLSKLGAVQRWQGLDYLLQVGSCIVHSAWVNPSDHMRPHNTARVPTGFTRRARGIAGGSHPQLVQSGSLRARGLCLSAGGWRVVEGGGLRSQGWDRWPLLMGSIFFWEFVGHTLRLGTY